MRQVEMRIRGLWERLARENLRLLALLRAGHTLAEVEEVLRSEESAADPTGGPADEDGER